MGDDYGAYVPDDSEINEILRQRRLMKEKAAALQSLPDDNGIGSAAMMALAGAGQAMQGKDGGAYVANLYSQREAAKENALKLKALDDEKGNEYLMKLAEFREKSRQFAYSKKQDAQKANDDRAAREDASKRHDETMRAIGGNKKEKDEYALATPYGLANTPDDAKQLKEAHESKSHFDAAIQEMIDLRTKHHGGAILNREDVGRAKQLSKDLLLEYKNMAKLGVLSQSDERILNQIIPEDPLAYNGIPGLYGQDQIMHRLKKFKDDSDRDFSTRVSTRTRGGGAGRITLPPAAPPLRNGGGDVSGMGMNSANAGEKTPPIKIGDRMTDPQGVERVRTEKGWERVTN